MVNIIVNYISDANLSNCPHICNIARQINEKSRAWVARDGSRFGLFGRSDGLGYWPDEGAQAQARFGVVEGLEPREDGVEAAVFHYGEDGAA